MKYVDDVIIVCKYQGVAKRLIHDFKYKGVIGIGFIIAQIIYRSINLPKCDLLVPVPVHKIKLSKRGFNQSEEIIKSLSNVANIAYLDLLLKTKNTKSQMSITNKDERKSNVENSFKINQSLINSNKKFLQGKIVMIIDDVLTTGNTMNECARILKENGVNKVIGIAFAHR